MLTALDIIKRNAGKLYPLVEEVVVNAPELGLLPAEMITGTSIEVTVRKGLPSVAFRNANEGVPRSKSTFETRMFQTHILDGQIAVDVGALKGSENPGQLMDDETFGVLQAAILKFGSQFYYGNPSADDKGFPGLIAQAANDADHVVDATGTTAKSSVWAISVTRDGPKTIFGGGSTISIAPEWRKETVLDGNGNPFTALVNNLDGRLGMALKNKNRAFRIKNLGTNAGKGLTDALLGQLLEKANTAGVTITHLLMTPRSQRQLQESRQAIVTSGIVPLPKDYEGIPIITTNSITNAE